MTPKEKVVFETKEEKKISEVAPGMVNGAGKAVDPVEAGGEVDPKPTILDEITSQNGTGDGAGKAANIVEDGTETSAESITPDEVTRRDAKTAVEDGAAKDEKKTSDTNYDDRDILEIILDKDNKKEETPDGIVKLSQPVAFDGEIIETLDLRELKNISQKKAKKIRKVYNEIAETHSVSPEITEEYAMAAASVITKLPVEFFEQLRHKDIIKIRGRVVNFFYTD